MWERSVPPITLLNTLRAFRSSHHPPKKIASVPFLPSPFYKTCERSVPPITLRSPSYKLCGRSVPPINLLQNLRAFRSSHHPPKKFASAPFLPSPSYKICERSVPPITLLKKLRAFRSYHASLCALASSLLGAEPFRYHPGRAHVKCR